jgi:succinoglycan biosynthesis transport protein ExoP
MVQALMPYHLSPAVGEEVEELKSSEYLRTYWHAVRRNIWLVAGITIFATLAVAVYEMRQPDQYEAQARIEIGRENGSPGFKADSSGGPSEDSVYFNTQLQILTSSALLRRVVKMLDLEHNDALLHPTLTVKTSVWQRLLNLNGNKDQGPTPKHEVLPTTSVATASLREDVGDSRKLEPYVGVLMKGLTAEPIKETRTDIKETRLIDISFYHNDPQIAARVVNAVADASAYMNLERKSESGAVAAEFLQKRIAELQSQIRHAEGDLLSYAGKNQIISLDASQNTVVERLAGLNRELLEAENERRKADAAYKAALAPDAAEAMAVEITNQNNIQEGKLAELRQRRVQLLVENTEEWPEVKEIDKQILEVESQIKDRRASAAANMRKTFETRYRQAAAREHSLRGAFNEQRNLTIAQNQAAINYKIMQQEIETNKGILQSLLQHSKENDIAQAGLLNSVHVIDYATVPNQPVGPKRLRNVGLAFVFSLGLAIAWVLVRENFDNTFRSMSDVEKKLRVPALSIVPSVGGAARHGLLSTLRPLALSGYGRAAGHPELLLGTPDPVIAEVYRQLRASLLLSREGPDLRSLLVTSSLPGEGKTTTAINTAVSLAESGANVLLIDGDLRRPSLHKVLEVNNEDGLSRALSDGLDGSDLFSIIKGTEVSGLSLLTSGPQLKNSAKLLDHEKLRQLFATLESKFTHIVIDSPPIVPFADSVILGAEVDGVLMVVQGGKSPQEIVLRSMKLLDDVDAVILGVVLNNTKLQPLDTYYQAYCQHYYQTAEAKAAGHSAEIS